MDHDWMSVSFFSAIQYRFYQVNHRLMIFGDKMIILPETAMKQLNRT